MMGLRALMSIMLFFPLLLIVDSTPTWAPSAPAQAITETTPGPAPSAPAKTTMETTPGPVSIQDPSTTAPQAATQPSVSPTSFPIDSQPAWPAIASVRLTATPRTPQGYANNWANLLTSELATLLGATVSTQDPSNQSPTPQGNSTSSSSSSSSSPSSASSASSASSSSSLSSSSSSSSTDSGSPTIYFNSTSRQSVWLTLSPYALGEQLKVLAASGKLLLPDFSVMTLYVNDLAVTVMHLAIIDPGLKRQVNLRMRPVEEDHLHIHVHGVHVHLDDDGQTRALSSTVVTSSGDSASSNPEPISSSSAGTDSNNDSAQNTNNGQSSGIHVHVQHVIIHPSVNHLHVQDAVSAQHRVHVLVPSDVHMQMMHPANEIHITGAGSFASTRTYGGGTSFAMINSETTKKKSKIRKRRSTLRKK